MINGLVCKAGILHPFQHVAVCIVPLDLEIRSLTDGQILPLDNCMVTKNPSAELLTEVYAIRGCVLCVCVLGKKQLFF